MKRNIHILQTLPANAYYSEMESPVGQLTIVTTAAGLHAILWDTDRRYPQYKKIIARFTQSNTEKHIIATKQQLQQYFQGKRKFFDLPLKISGTKFQQQAWQQLLKIPYGTCLTYGEQALQLGDKNKARAVGMANSLNPISIIIPCHRVIGSNGKLTGFAGGIDKKAYLLQLEQ